MLGLHIDLLLRPRLRPIQRCVAGAGAVAWVGFRHRVKHLAICAGHTTSCFFRGRVGFWLGNCLRLTVRDQLHLRLFLRSERQMREGPVLDA
eukprot:COSAG04_NODE_209_length_20232_cov_116.817315_13_plen_92_part_00